MMEIEKREFDPSWSMPTDNGFAREHKFEEVGAVFEEMKGKPLAADGFVALDIESLSLLAAASAPSQLADSGEKYSKDLIAGIQVPVKKTFTKKGSQRGGERRTADSVAGAIDRESLSVLIQVASDGEATTQPHEKAPRVAVVGAGGRNKRFAGRRLGPRLRFDSRRVVLLFATLSSMGTLILLYFTLSLGKMPADNNNAR